MKNFIMAFCLSILSFSTFAQELTCLDKLLPYSRHSGLHQLSKEEWSDGKDHLDTDGAKSAFEALTNGKLMCKTDEVTVKLDPICTILIPDLPQSNLCYLFSNLGYFIISKDAGKNVNFIFSRDKTYSEP